MRPQDGVALLFKPPFDKTPLDPGYIKGYPPGMRENGGQYTHAALWSVMALAKLGEGDKAAGLFSPAQSDQSCPHAGRCAPLQDRALCRRRRHLCGRAACRTRRLDLVYRLGGMDAARRDREHPRSARSGPVAADLIHASRRLGRASGSCSATVPPAMTFGSKTRGASAVALCLPNWTARRRPATLRCFRWRTTAQPI